MTDHELALVVARIQAGDNRTVDRVTMNHFRDTIGHLAHADALEAVSIHFRESTEYLTAAHINRIAHRLAEERRMRTAIEDGGPAGSGPPAPNNIDAWSAAWDDPAEFSRQAAIYNRQLADAGYPLDDRYPVAERINDPETPVA